MENDVKRRRRACTNAMYESSTCMYERVAVPSPCIEIFSPRFARTENFGITFSGYSFGILDVVSTSGVMLCGNSYEHPCHDEHLRARLGRSVRVGGRQERRCSLFDSRRFSPNTSSVQTCRNRQTFVTCARTHASSCPHGSERQPTCAYRTGEQFSENCESSVQKIFLDFR